MRALIRKGTGRWSLVLLILSIFRLHGEVNVQQACVQMSASYASGQITLQWQGDGNAHHYEVSRKALGAGDWTYLGNLEGGSTGWTDSSVGSGAAYEYKVIKRGANGYDGFGYIAVGADRSPVEQRGRVIVLVAEQLAEALPTELTRLERDLVGDGWSVVRRNISTAMTSVQVKEMIRGIYDQDRANTKALFLFGHIAVPYSGDLMPDGHEDHRGAWPADVYYGEFDGEWTDNLTVRTNGFNRNVPDDGRFDQSFPPGPVRLQIGRVDLSNMTCFANKTPARYEVDLARQYLNKDHNFRHGRLDARRRAVVFDRQYRGTELEPQTSMAYRAFPAFFGRDQIRVLGQNEYFPLLETEPYLWSYAVSGGSQYGSDHIGTSDSFALNDPKVVFTSFLGSYFGDWDRESNFLRAPLGTSSYTLVAMYGGQPAWLLHPMAIGEPIGYSAMLTQNNRTNGLYVAHPNWGIGQVHVALLGDPTLRLHPVAPVRDLTGAFDASGARLTWTASSDPGVFGVYVYKASSIAGPFTRITGDAIAGSSFADPSGRSGDYYMVRALKKEITPSGSYYNLSQGVFFPDGSAGGGGAVEAPASLGISKVTPGAVTLEWLQRGAGVRGYRIERRVLPSGGFSQLAEITGDASSFVDRPSAGAAYGYRVKTLGFGSESAFSDEATINLAAPAGAFVGADVTTGGNWIGSHGQEGHLIASAATNLPPYVSLTASNALTYVLSWNWTNNAVGLLRPDGDRRVAAYRYGAHHQPLTLSFRFNDSTLHRVGIYIADYEDVGRHGRIEVIDPFSNTVLAGTTYTNIGTGVYVFFDLRNYADVRLTPLNGNAVLSGIFFSSAAAPLPSNSSVSFQGIDATTQGDFQNAHGQAGWVAVGAGGSVEPSIQYSGPSAERWTWTDATDDRRALNVGAAKRLASCWYSDSQIVFDVTVSGQGARPMALYFLDWDFFGRVEEVTIADPAGVVLDQRRVENFGAGHYYIWHVRGPVRVTIRSLNARNAALSGIFFGPARIVSTAPPSLSSVLNFDGGGYDLQISGQPGQTIVLQSSADFRLWQDVDRRTLSSTTLNLSIPLSDEVGARVFRVRLEQ